LVVVPGDGGELHADAVGGLHEAGLEQPLEHDLVDGLVAHERDQLLPIAHLAAPRL
jgi:hypothetical protein